VNQNLRLFLNINNLNDEPQVSYQGFGQTGNPEDTTRYGFRASLGANYTF
jgi:outer membrane receptor protein involved in Fe transport